MQATTNQQQAILELGSIDLEIQRAKKTIADLADPNRMADFRAKQTEFASQLIDARNALDSLISELRRAEVDLDLVEQRIAKDNQRLNQTSSPKDAQGIQFELETLAKRKSDLEDIELAVLERKEIAESDFKDLNEAKSSLDAQIFEKENEIQAQIMKLRSGLELLTQKRAQVASNLPGELFELYEKKAARAVAVGRLNGRECGACRMNIQATAIAEIQNLPADEIATCPECQAILIR